jgi:hypothetical protein
MGSLADEPIAHISGATCIVRSSLASELIAETAVRTMILIGDLARKAMNNVSAVTISPPTPQSE